jgi:hypothetical protein
MPETFLLLAPLLLLPIVSLLRFVGCDGIAKSLALAEVTIDPATVSLGPGESIQFMSRVPDASLIWAATRGTVDTMGNYKAPDPFDPAITSATITVVASEQGSFLENGYTAVGTAQITLQAASLKISVPFPLRAGEPHTFIATVTGFADKTVTWSTDVGVIAQTGEYVAPGTFDIDTPQATITAVSNVNPAIRDQVVVILIGNGAKFLRSDTATHGNWNQQPPTMPPTAVYGSMGYALAANPPVINKPVGLASLQDVIALDEFHYAPGTPRDLNNPVGPPATLSDVWYTRVGNRFSIDLDFSNYDSHQIAVYCAMWDGQPRTQTIRILDGDSPASEFDPQTVSAFDSGVYLVWQVIGHVIIEVTKGTGPNAVISGIFFD